MPNNQAHSVGVTLVTRHPRFPEVKESVGTLARGGLGKLIVKSSRHTPVYLMFFANKGDARKISDKNFSSHPPPKRGHATGLIIVGLRFRVR